MSSRKSFAIFGERPTYAFAHIYFAKLLPMKGFRSVPKIRDKKEEDKSYKIIVVSFKSITNVYVTDKKVILKF